MSRHGHITRNEPRMQGVLERCMGSITVGSWRVVNAQGATRTTDDHDITVLQSNSWELHQDIPHRPTSYSDRRGQRNAMIEEERAIPRERKSSSLEDAASLAMSGLDVGQVSGCVRSCVPLPFRS